MTHGGKREGAGVKKGSKHKKTKSAERQRDIFNKMVDAVWAPLIEAQLESAMKDTRARQYTIDQRVGKAKESVVADVTIEKLILDI